MARPARLFALLFVVVSCLILVSGCAAAKPPQPLVLTGSDVGTTHSLKVGQTVNVTLDANPTTGYSWALDGPLPPQLKQSGDPDYTATSTSLGTGGTEVWQFVGTSAGKAALKMKYWRSFEPTATPGSTFEVTLDVK